VTYELADYASEALSMNRVDPHLESFFMLLTVYMWVDLNVCKHRIHTPISGRQNPARLYTSELQLSEKQHDHPNLKFENRKPSNMKHLQMQQTTFFSMTELAAWSLQAN
jgi:hypothetical protein